MNNKINEKKVNDIIHSVGLNNFLTDNQTREIVESQFRFTYKTIRNLILSELTEEEIEELKTNFYYKYIGKLYTDSEIIKKHRRKEEYFKQLRKLKEEENERTSEFEVGGSDSD